MKQALGWLQEAVRLDPRDKQAKQNLETVEQLVNAERVQTQQFGGREAFQLHQKAVEAFNADRYEAAIKYLRLRVKKGGGEEDNFQEEARRSLYRLVHKPGIVVDTNFAFQRLDTDPSRDSVKVLYEN